MDAKRKRHQHAPVLLCLGLTAALAPAIGMADLVPASDRKSLGSIVLENGINRGHCSTGICTLRGGIERGNNRFHRLTQWDTRSGITRTEIQNAPGQNVLIGVAGNLPTWIGSPVILQAEGGLAIISPAGVSIGGNASFTNTKNLLLTTQNQLRVGDRWFNAFSTIPDNDSAWSSELIFSREQLRSSISEREQAGIASPAAIEIQMAPGVALSVDRTLLIDSADGELGIINSALSAGAPALPLPNPELTIANDSPTQIALYGEEIALQGSSLEANGGGNILLQANRRLIFDQSTTRSLKLFAFGNEVSLSNQSRLIAPRGLMQLQGNKGINISDSQLILSPTTTEEVKSLGLGSLITTDALIVVESTPGLIVLSSKSDNGTGVALANSAIIADAVLDGISDGTSTIPAADDPAWPNYTLQEIMAGSVSIDSKTGIKLINSAISANASHGMAGEIALFNLSNSQELILSNTTLTASAPAGSGDLRLHSNAGITISNNSLLSAITSGVPLSNQDFDGSTVAPYIDYYSYTLFPQGEIRISNSGAGSINISDSTIEARYNHLDKPIFYTERIDPFDPNDNGSFYSPGGLIQILSDRPVEIGGLRTRLDTSSSGPFSGKIEIHSLESISIDKAEITSTTGPAEVPDNFINPPDIPNGRINISSGAEISIRNSQLDASNNTAPNALIQSSIFINSKGSTDQGLSFVDASLDAGSSSPGGYAGSIILRSNGPIHAEGTPFNTRGDFYPDFSQFENPLTTSTDIQITANGDMRLLGSNFSVGQDDPLASRVTLFNQASEGIIDVNGSSFLPNSTDSTETANPRVLSLSSFNPDNEALINNLQASIALLDENSNASINAEIRPIFSDTLSGIKLTAFQGALTNTFTDLVIDNSNPNLITVVQVTQSPSPQTAAVNATPAQVFDTTKPEDLKNLRDIVGNDGVFASLSPAAAIYLSTFQSESIIQKPFPVDGGDPVSATSTVIKSDNLDGRPGATLSAESIVGLQKSPNMQASKIANSDAAVSLSSFATTTLSATESATSLERSEQKSAAGVAKFLQGQGHRLADPAVPTVQQLQSSLRNAAQAKARRAVQAGSARLEAPQVGVLPNTSSEAQSDLTARTTLKPYRQYYKPAIIRIGYSEPTSQKALTDTAVLPKSTDKSLIDIVLILPDGEPMGWRVDVNRTRLKKLLGQYYQDLATMSIDDGSRSASASNQQDIAADLYQLLLEPARQVLDREQIGGLIISADLGLIDIPFIGLRDGSNFLSDRFSISVTPSLAYTKLGLDSSTAQLTSGQSVQKSQKRALFGASHFKTGLAPLPLVLKEIAEIRDGSQSTHQTEAWIDDDFNLPALARAFSDEQTQQMHIATHAEIAYGHDRQPVIYTKDALISLKDLSFSRFGKNLLDLDLVTLSACRTAVSTADLELGFAGLALQMGSKSAIGSKWYVDDLASSIFFVLYYRYLDDGYFKDDALRAAQDAFRENRIRLEENEIIGPDGDIILRDIPRNLRNRYPQGFSNPYYWSGYQLIGSPW